MRTDYYAAPFGRTGLDLYWEAPDGTRHLHRQLRDQAAYDTWHVPGYLQEIVTARRLRRAPALRFADIPRPEKSLLLYLLLAADPALRRVFELGSSLFEIIDGLQLVHEFFGRGGEAPGPDPATLEFGGAEISPLCAEASVVLHPGVQCRVFPDVTAIDGSYDLLYDRIVSGAVFETVGELAAFLNRFPVALLNLFVSKGETFVCPMVGRAFTYFSLPELHAALDRPLLHLFGTRAPRASGEFEAPTPAPVVEGFFLMAPPATVERLQHVAARFPDVRAFFEAKAIALRAAADLLA